MVTSFKLLDSNPAGVLDFTSEGRLADAVHLCRDCLAVASRRTPLIGLIGARRQSAGLFERLITR